MQMEDEDSDAGDFGLEASTAEFSAVDRQTPVYLYRPKVSNVTLAPKSRNVLFFAIRALSRHIAEQRSDARVVWKCAQCRKGYAQCRKGYLKMHATEGHIPKYKGVVEMPQAFE